MSWGQGSSPSGGASLASRADAPSGGTLSWQRLHPLTPLVSGGRGLLLLVLYAAEGSLHDNGSGEMTELIVVLAITALAVVAGLVRWLVTRWALDGPTLRIETGLLRRDARQLPVARIQAVDVVRPFLARIFGLAELRVRLAGNARSNGRIAYLSEPVAIDLRARLLAGHHGLDASTPEPAEQLVTSVPVGSLVASVLLSAQTFVGLCMVVLVGVLTVYAPAVAAGFGGGLLAYLIGFLSVSWRRVTEQYGFTVGVAPDGIRVKRGLFSTVAETVPFERVQAVRRVEPLPWKPFGWCRLEVDVAGSPGQEQGTRSSRTTKALLPVGDLAAAQVIFRSLLGLKEFEMSPPPARAAWKTPLRYHFLSGGSDGRVVASTHGRVRRVTTWVPLEKVQSVRRVQGPVQRRFKLASVYVDAAGRRVSANLFDRDVEEAERLVGQLVGQSRAARRRVSRRAAAAQVRDTGGRGPAGAGSAPVPATPWPAPAAAPAPAPAPAPGNPWAGIPAQEVTTPVPGATTPAPGASPVNPWAVPPEKGEPEPWPPPEERPSQGAQLPSGQPAPPPPGDPER